MKLLGMPFFFNQQNDIVLELLIFFYFMSE